MPIGAHRWALLATVVLVLVSVFVPVGTAAPANVNTLAVVVTLTNGAPAPVGTTVTLTATATHENCTSTLEQGSPEVTFTPPTCDLEPGWFTASVLPQVDYQTSTPVLLLPSNGGSNTQYESQSDLTGGSSIPVDGIALTPMNQSLEVQVNTTTGFRDAKDAVELQLLDPSFSGFSLATVTVPAGRGSSNEGGFYNFTNVPAGTWTVYASGYTPSSPSDQQFNYTSAAITNTNSGQHSAFLLLGSAGVSGFVEPTDHGWFYNQTNLTLYDYQTGGVYSFTNPSNAYLSHYSTYFQAGLFNSLIAQGGSRQFTLLVAPQGYTTAWANLTANGVTGLQGMTFHVNDLANDPATVQQNTITFSDSSFNVANITSQESYSNDSSIWGLPNASVGDLYAQVGLDFRGGSGIDATPWAWHGLTNWLAADGAMYPPGQGNLEVNGTFFGGNRTVHDVWGSTPTNLNFTSGQKFSYWTEQNYSLSKGIHNGYQSYNLTMGFRYPSAGESLSYTVHLPADYVLAGNTVAPLGTRLTPAGPGGTWTSFTLTPYQSPETTDVPIGPENSTAYFQVERVENVTAVVAVTSANFAFANKTNVVNDTHENYTVIVGGGQNASLTSQSVFPSGFNITSLDWHVGTQATAKAQCYGATISPQGWLNVSGACTTVWVTYPTSAGAVQKDQLVAIANGGNRSTQNFTVLVDTASPTPAITLNDTHAYFQTISSNVSFVQLNWGQELKFNATNSTSLIQSSLTTPAGRLSDAIWNISATPSYYAVNYSIGAKAASVFGNVTYSFLGAGSYYSSYPSTLGGVTIPTSSGPLSGKFHGWVYTVKLTLYDAGGNKANAVLFVFVNDTEKPDAIGAVQGGPDFNPIADENQNVSSGTDLKNGTCTVVLVDKWSYDPHNGSVAAYSWEISNDPASGFKTVWKNVSAGSSGVAPTTSLDESLAPPNTPTPSPYNITLNATDLAGNWANTTFHFTCSINTTLNPILQATDLSLSGGTTMTVGDSYTLTVNITNLGGIDSVADNSSLRVYTASSTASTSQSNQGGSVSWWGWTGGIRNGTTAFSGSLATIHYNNTYQADFTFKPGSAGSYEVCVNSTATNEFAGSYKTGANVACLAVTVNQSPIEMYIIYGVVSAAVIVVLVAVGILLTRRRRGGGKKTTGGKGKKEEEEEEEEDEEEEEESPKSKGKPSDKDEDDE